MGAPLDPTLGLGLSGIDDFRSNYPFIDLQKQARPWAATGWTWQQLFDAGHIDAAGWVTSYPSGVTVIGGSFNGPDGYLPAGRYVLTWEGSTTMTLYGDRSVVSSVQGRIVFDKITGGTFGYNMTNFDTVTIPKPKLYRLEHEGLLNLGVEFNPQWLDIVKTCRQLRFKDWMVADSSLEVAWSDRLPDNYASYATFGKSPKGVPVEVMVRLANLVGVDPWFCFPYKASDDYITQFVTYVEANLNSGLQATFEYGNEPWNTAAAFANQRDWNNAQAIAAWTSTGATLDEIQWNTHRATLMAGIVQTIYGGEYAARAKCVINVNVINPQLATAFVCPHWLSGDAGSYIDPRTVIDSCAVTSYFGGQYANNSTRASDLLSRIASDGAEATYTWLANELITNGAINMSVPFVAAQWQECLGYLDAYSIDLVMYEGGQHIEDSIYEDAGMSGAQQATMTTFLQGFVLSTQITEVYQASWDAWALVGSGPYMQYVDVLLQGNAGTSWGMLRNLLDSQPKATLLRGLNNSEASWFGNGGGAQYAPQTIAAADDEDVAVGARGGTVVGTTGHEIVNVAGARSDYSLTKEGSNYRLTKTGFELLLNGVEVLRFTG